MALEYVTPYPEVRRMRDDQRRGTSVRTVRHQIFLDRSAFCNRRSVWVAGLPLRAAAGQRSESSWWVPIAGEAPKRLPQYVGTTAIHPDGRTIAFSLPDDTPSTFDIWSMEPFLKRPESTRAARHDARGRVMTPG
jgi:hypothetical protein